MKAESERAVQEVGSKMEGALREVSAAEERIERIRKEVRTRVT